MTGTPRPFDDPGLEALWRNALSRWEEDAAHQAFLEACRASGRLADAAARYRSVAGDHSRRETAEKKLTAITLLAFAELESTRRPLTKAKASWTLLATVLLVVSALAVLALLLVEGN